MGFVVGSVAVEDLFLPSGSTQDFPVSNLPCANNSGGKGPCLGSGLSPGTPCGICGRQRGGGRVVPPEWVYAGLPYINNLSCANNSGVRDLALAQACHQTLKVGFVVGSVAVEELSLQSGSTQDFPMSATSKHCSALTGRNVSN